MMTRMRKRKMKCEDRGKYGKWKEEKEKREEKVKDGKG
jgi:hypothetical protein